MIDGERVACNLLSSAPLVFNLFAPMAQELLHASSALNELFPIATADARGILFEHGRMSNWDGHNRVYVTRDNVEEVGRILLSENVRSVNYRYGGRIRDNEKNAAASYRFAYVARPRSAVQLIKAVHCLDYRSARPRIGNFRSRGGFAGRLFLRLWRG
jgi:hypothetical protein